MSEIAEELNQLKYAVKTITHNKTSLSKGRVILSSHRKRLKRITDLIVSEKDIFKRLAHCEKFAEYLDSILKQISDRQVSKLLPQVKSEIANLSKQVKSEKEEQENAGANLAKDVLELAKSIEDGPDWIYAYLSVEPDYTRFKSYLDQLGAKTQTAGVRLDGKHDDFYLFSKGDFASFICRPKYFKVLLEGLIACSSSEDKRHYFSSEFAFFLDKPKKLLELKTEKIEKLASDMSKFFKQELGFEVQIRILDKLSQNEVLKIKKLLIEKGFESEKHYATLYGDDSNLQVRLESFITSKLAYADRYVSTLYAIDANSGNLSDRLDKDDRPFYCDCIKTRVREKPSSVKAFKDLFDLFKGEELDTFIKKEKHLVLKADHMLAERSAALCFTIQHKFLF